jgi:metallo-beta-lactamase class B
MRRCAQAGSLFLLSSVWGVFGAAAQELSTPLDSADTYIAAATATAGEPEKGMLSLCDPGALAAPPVPVNNTAEPAKVFDNLYFLGIPSVSAWAITTPAGIVLIDTLDSAQEAQTYIEGGLRKLKLDPRQIKYIVVTHAHLDHFGGAGYLAEKYHATLVMSDVDWDALAHENAGNAHIAIPRRGRGVKDGDTLSFGGTTLEFYLTPPHTPGTLSLIFPLHDGESTHVAALWGGTAFNFTPTEENFTAYIASAQRFAKVARDEGADVPLSTHSAFDEALQKIAALKTRTLGQTNPFVTGPGGAEKYLAVATECAMAWRAKLRAVNQ